MRRFLFLLCLGWCVAGPAWGAAPEVEVEKWVGAQLARLFEAQYGVVSDPLLTQWVEPVSASVAACSRRQDVRYHFSILDSDQVNAFSLPGGYIFVTRGLLERAASDDEVASVLAHEVAHTASRHAVKGFATSLALATAATGLTAKESQLVQTLAATTAYLLVLHYSRTYENEADEVGLGYAYQAGYDPQGLLQFLESLASASENPSRLERLFATHPPTATRIATARANPLLARDNVEAMWRRAAGLEGRLEYGRAMALYESLWKEQQPGAAERLAWLKARVGDEQGGARLAEEAGIAPPEAPVLSISPGPGGTPEEADAVKAYRVRLDGRVAALRPRFAAVQEEVERVGGRGHFNDTMADVALLSPVHVDYKWLALLGAARWVAEQVSECLLSARNLTGNFHAAVGDAGELADKVARPEACFLAGEFMRECDLALVDLDNAAGEAERSMRALRAAAADITPVAYALLDPVRWNRTLTMTEALGLAALAERAVEEALQASEARSGALECSRHARMRLLEEALSVRFAIVSPSARRTMFDMALGRLHCTEGQLTAGLDAGTSFGGAVAVVALSETAGLSIEEIEREVASSGGAVEALDELRLPSPGMYSVLRQLDRQSRQALR